VAAKTENQKAKGKNQKAKITEPGRGPAWEGAFTAPKRSIFSVVAVCPQSRQSSMAQSSMTQLLTGAANGLPRGIFAARNGMEL
jgi:hypothetical protein